MYVLSGVDLFIVVLLIELDGVIWQWMPIVSALCVCLCMWVHTYTCVSHKPLASHEESIPKERDESKMHKGTITHD